MKLPAKLLLQFTDEFRNGLTRNKMHQDASTCQAIRSEFHAFTALPLQSVIVAATGDAAAAVDAAAAASDADADAATVVAADAASAAAASVAASVATFAAATCNQLCGNPKLRGMLMCCRMFVTRLCYGSDGVLFWM